MPSQDRRWALYEAVIADFESQDEQCEVLVDHRVTGRESGVMRQVDVWIIGFLGGLKHRVTVAVECRAYGSGNKIGIKDVDAFCGFLKDVGASKGVLVTTSSFTSGARARAEGADIEARVLTFEEALHFGWSDYVSGDSCETPFGCWGTVQWSYHEKPSESAHGSCDACGTFHIRCGFCGHSDSYLEEEGYIRCSNDDCRGVFRVSYHKGVIGGFEARLREEDGHEADEAEKA